MYSRVYGYIYIHIYIYIYIPEMRGITEKLSKLINGCRTFKYCNYPLIPSRCPKISNKPIKLVCRPERVSMRL